VDVASENCALPEEQKLALPVKHALTDELGDLLELELLLMLTVALHVMES